MQVSCLTHIWLEFDFLLGLLRNGSAHSHGGFRCPREHIPCSLRIACGRTRGFDRRQHRPRRCRLPASRSQSHCGIPDCRPADAHDKPRCRFLPAVVCLQHGSMDLPRCSFGWQCCRYLLALETLRSLICSSC